MRRSVISSIVTLSLLMAVPRLAGAAVVWTATHEAGDLKEWTGGANLTKTLPDNTVRKNVEVVGEKVYGGKLACKVTVHPDDTFGQYNQDRVDLNHHGMLSGEGKDSYLSGYFFLPEDSKTRTEILFYETESSFRNWMDLWVEPKQGGGTTVKFGIESQGATLGSVLLWTGDWTPAVWHQVAIHVHWSTNSNQGLVDLWLDGKLVIDAVKHNTKFDNNAMFFNAGMHRLLPQNFTEVLYMDDFIEADALADIHVGAPWRALAEAAGRVERLGAPERARAAPVQPLEQARAAAIKAARAAAGPPALVKPAPVQEQEPRAAEPAEPSPPRPPAAEVAAAPQRLRLQAPAPRRAPAPPPRAATPPRATTAAAVPFRVAARSEKNPA